jgi:hypothetical protein
LDAAKVGNHVWMRKRRATQLHALLAMAIRGWNRLPHPAAGDDASRAGYHHRRRVTEHHPPLDEEATCDYYGTHSVILSTRTLNLRASCSTEPRS